MDVNFQFPNGFSHNNIWRGLIKIAELFQFPNGFSRTHTLQQKFCYNIPFNSLTDSHVCDNGHTVEIPCDFQFPNGFSRKRL